MNEARSPALDETAAMRKRADKQFSMEATVGATMAATKRHPSRDILRARRACPGCGVTMTYHALTYKHRCRGGPDAKRRRRLEQLDARIERRLGPAGGELGQRAGEEDIEQQAGEEERLEQQAGGEAAPLEEETVGLAAVAQA